MEACMPVAGTNEKENKWRFPFDIEPMAVW